MIIPVEYKGHHGILPTQNYRMTRLALAKHLAIAGQGFTPNVNKFVRTIGMFLHFRDYLQRESFYTNNCFSSPPDEVYDPTEIGQFSNLAGKAIADFLAKRIDGSLFTVNYESAMKLQNKPLSGPRPDLLAFNPNGNGFRFAIEAKGYSGGCKDMGVHKTQSEQGGMPVNFTVACVSFNLYRNIQCKYFDPYNDNIPFDDELFKLLTCSYYSGFSEFLEQNFMNPLNEIEYQDEYFYEVPFTYRLLKNLIPNNSLFPGCFYCKLTESYKLRLLLPVKIREYAQNGLPRETKPFVFDAENKESHYIYVDNDRIGLRIGG